MSVSSELNNRKTDISEIKLLIQSREFAALRLAFHECDPAELAELIKDFSEQEQAVIFRILPRTLSAETFEYLDFDTQKTLLKGLGQTQVAAILNEMSPDDRTALLEELPGPAVQQLLALLSTEERAIALSLLGYPENSVGRLMTPDYLAIQSNWTVNDVLTYIRQRGQVSESFNVLYVTDKQGKLVDDIHIRTLLLAPLEHKVEELMNYSCVSLSVMDEKENAIAIFRKYDKVALPVIDSEGFLIGIVTIDDVMDVVEETDTEDIQKFGGLDALDDAYMSTPLLEMIKKRARWLVILFLGEMLTATAMAFFQDEIAKAVVLALFLPLIISSGGNSGSQAATLIVRAMALGEIKLRDWWKVFRRELISGVALGAILGTIGFVRIAAWNHFFHSYGQHWILVGLTVGVSLIGVVLWGSLSGSMLPFVMKKLGADPAASSAPFVATLVDVTGLVIYFTVAAIFMRGILL